MSKMAYDITRSITFHYFKGFTSLTKIQRIEWNNRGMSTVHSIYITIMSIYLVFFSDLYSKYDQHQRAIMFTLRSSPLSTFTLGVSVGYFILDLSMIYHLLSLFAIAYSVFSGEGQFYTYMVLISEATTPGINLRWFLDTIGLKTSNAYIINGAVMFFAWLIARILLFGYLFYHVSQHYAQIVKMHIIGCILVFCVPSILAMMNIIWFGKILKGLKKQLCNQKVNRGGESTV